ncbi:hypothetical protein [Streptomyces alkaliterrae]|nr:hypothetical protein [Streptomyces alkaliterrae]
MALVVKVLTFRAMEHGIPFFLVIPTGVYLCGEIALGFLGVL